MKIIRLEAENVKRLRAVNITPEGSVVVIKGQNAQGKSSVLDAITFALGGRSVQPPKVIREGQETAQVVLELDDLVVERRWTSNDKSTVVVRSKDGAKYPSPQAVLDGLVGKLSFDPLTFMRLEPKKQVETLRQMVGVDFTELDQRRGALYERRTEINRQAAALKAQLDTSQPVEAPDEEVSITDLVEEQNKLRAQLVANDKVRASLQAATGIRKGREEQVSQLRRRIADLQKELAQRETELEMATDAEQAAKAEAATLVDPDFDSVAERMRTADTTNRKVQFKKKRAELSASFTTAHEAAEKLSLEIAQVDADKEALLAQAKFPVPGLAFTEEGLTLNGIPLEQASAAEQLRVSLGMGIALNPKLKVLLIRDGSLLDEKSMGLVAEMADKAGAQIWVERVGKADQVGVLIEDGAVVSEIPAEVAAP